MSVFRSKEASRSDNEWPYWEGASSRCVQPSPRRRPRLRAAMALDLPVTVRLLDKPSKREVLDNDGVLTALLEAWVAGGHPLPEGHAKEDLHWGVKSDVPKKQGLKSSAAVCMAALRALCDATDTSLGDHDLVALAAMRRLPQESPSRGPSMMHGLVSTPVGNSSTFKPRFPKAS